MYALVRFCGRGLFTLLVHSRRETQVRVGPFSLFLRLLPLPLGAPPIPAPACFIVSHSHGREVRRGLTTSTGYVGNETQGEGAPDHQALRIAGVQRLQAFCHWFVLLSRSFPHTGVFLGGFAVPLSPIPRPFAALPRGAGWTEGGSMRKHMTTTNMTSHIMHPPQPQQPAPEH